MDRSSVPPACADAVHAEEHIGLAHLCAKRFTGRGLPYDELVREATVALVAAAARFDPSRGVCFSTYAVPCVLSDLRRACDRAAPMHVPRTDRALLRQAAALRREEMERTGQEPTVEELAEGLNLPAAELGAALTADARMQSLRSQDEEVKKPASTADERAERFVDYLLLLDVIARLPKPLPQLIRLRFLECRTQQHTAQLMRLSQAQVSKLERRARAQLRAALAVS